MIDKSNKDNKQCCPPFKPDKWDKKEFEWQDKKFIRDNIKTFMYMPINFGLVMKRMQAKVEKADASMPDYLCLSHHTSKWHMYAYLAVDKEVEGAVNTTISGKFLSKVYDGPFKNTGKWCKDFESFAKNKGYEVKKWYMWYTTCPKCAKRYGHNYVIVVGQVSG
jgi:hypothetical protein